jgi:hypothetical protein
MIDFFKENVWVWAGALIVIYTLSGQVQRTGIAISLAAFSIQWITFLIRRGKE